MNFSFQKAKNNNVCRCWDCLLFKYPKKYVIHLNYLLYNTPKHFCVFFLWKSWKICLKSELFDTKCCPIYFSLKWKTINQINRIWYLAEMKMTLSKAKRFSFVNMEEFITNLHYKITKYFRGLVWSHILYLVHQDHCWYLLYCKVAVSWESKIKRFYWVALSSCLKAISQ